MSAEDKSYKHLHTSVESKEGERRLLSSNKANARSPSLDINPNSNYISDEVALDYLAELLVEVYVEYYRNGNRQKKGSDILSGINKRTG